ncbi:MAG: hypothetical protein KAX18_14575 [Candidatus Lokiarchaeota archaeon]|nr:hypothetical protein [Candidatus Lokiarchaeota archaeon]
MNIKKFLIDFGNKILYYLFITDFVIATWIWINTDTTLNLFTKIMVFLTSLPIVFLPSLAKRILKDAENREESIRLFDVVYGIFIWISALILGSTGFNIVSLIAMVIILLIIYNVISMIAWRYHPRLSFRIIIPYIIINGLIILYLVRFFDQGIDYYRTANIIEFGLGIIILIIIAFLFAYNELSELKYIFNL